jgi:diaminopimelate epimerase
MRFVKMHGLGNDYVLVDAFDGTGVPREPGELARRISDRHRGVGGDGLIVIEPSDAADCRMRIWNRDGSEGETCGNGLRCLGKYVHERGLVPGERISVDTAAGRVTLLLDLRDGRVDRVRTELGAPRLHPEEIPVDLPGSEVVDRALEVEGRSLRVTCVSMGNPHCVVMADDVETIPVARIGPAIEKHPLFPLRTNVEFVRVEGTGRLRQRTWERGVGETQACGSGAAASVVACGLLGRGRGPWTVRLDGGELDVEWRDSGVTVAGPAVEVFRGEWTG